jgi:hypothetical protein
MVFYPDVAYVSHICCNNMFLMFQLFRSYVAASGFMLQVASVLFGCFHVFHTHVESAYFKCFICFQTYVVFKCFFMLQVFYIVPTRASQGH